MKDRFNRFVMAAALLMSLGLAACSQQTSTEHTLSGRVLYKGTMAPMREIVMTILQENGKEGLNTKLLTQTIITNVDGSYSFTFRPFKNEDATNILLTSSAGTANDLAFERQTFNLPVVFEEVDAALVLEDPDLELDILGDPFGFLEVRVNRDDPLIFGENISITVSGDGYKYSTRLGFGDGVNRTLSYPVYTSRKAFVEWESDFSGVVESGSDSVTCRTGQATTYVLNF